MRTVSIRIPCQRFSVRVTLGHAEGLSTFEQFMLRSIAGGANSVEKLAAVLTLDRNVVLDTCVDLLRAGYVILHRADAAIEVSKAVRDEMGDPLAPQKDWARRLAPAAVPEPLEYDLLQDLVSGSVFPSARGLNTGGRFLIAPENQALDEITSIQKPVLLDATARLLRRVHQERSDRGSTSDFAPLSRRGVRVTDVALGGGAALGTGVAATPTTIVVEITCRKTIDDERRNFVIVGPRELSGTVRRRIASRLSSMWEQGIARGEGQFFAQLDERLTSVEALVDDQESEVMLEPFRACSEFISAADSIVNGSPSSAAEALEAHARIDLLERRATQELDEAAALEASAAIVVGAADHHALLFRALNEAKHQVILASPWVGQIETNKGIQDALVNAVGRGVRIHLLWGVDRGWSTEDGFGPVSRDLLGLLAPRDQRLGGLFVAKRAAGIHAKLVTCDLSWALVSSCNVLNSGPDRHELEIGVHVSSPNSPSASEQASPDGQFWSPVDRRAPVASAITEVIRWSRGIIQDFMLRPAVVDDPSLDGRRPLAPSVEVDGSIEPPGDVGLWRGAVERRAKDLSARSRRLGSVVQPVVDGRHRELFVAATQNAKRRLVISSKDLGIGLLGQGAADLVAAARRRGVSIQIFHSGVSEWSEVLERRRKELADLGVEFHVRDVHAKVLVCDDWSIVSSYNFLSFAGYFDEHKRARHELGLRVLSPEVADILEDTLREAPRR